MSRRSNRTHPTPSPTPPPPPVAAACAKSPDPIALFAPGVLNGSCYGTMAPALRRELERRVLLADDARTILALGDPARWERTRDRRTVGFLGPESDELYPRAITALNLVDEVLVPSAWAAEIVGVATPRPVHVVPLGVDTDLFAYRRRERGERLRFLHLTPHADDTRKGADLAIAAFQRAFPKREDVSLLIRSAHPTQYAPKDDPRIRYGRGAVDHPLIAELLYGFDALIATSRAEAFALAPLEAMASGLPAVYTGATGCADYADLGLPVRARDVRATRPRLGSWTEPYLDDIVDRLLEIDGDYDGVMDRTAADARAVRERFTWARTMDAIVAALASA